MITVQKVPQIFEVEFPVIVVGAGAAGFCAALAARDTGADVLLLERDETPRGSTSMSQGNVCAVGSKMQRAAGVKDSPDAFYDDVMARTRNKANPEIARVIAERSGETVDWLVERHKIPFEMNLNWAGFFGHSVNRIHGMPTMNGEELHGALMRAADEAGVTLITGAHVTGLFADETGRVTGVTFTRADGSTEDVGCQALILATCGFGANEDMVKKYIPEFGTSNVYRYFGHEGNEGEGIAWGIELGAGLGSMDAFQGYGALGDPYGIIMNYDALMNGGIMVNIEGQRYSNEVADISAQALNTLAQPQGNGWVIFDDARRDIVVNMPEFVDLNKLGAVKSAATAQELAAIIGLPPEGFEATIKDVQAMAAGEKSCPFGRDFTKNPPFSGALHAVKTTGALFHTQGGLKIDANARVLAENGTPLPNVYACGGTAEGISGSGCDGYLPAAGLCTAVTLGMVSGQAAAALVKSA